MPGQKLQANMKTNNYRKKCSTKIRQIRKDKGKLSDNTIDNRTAYRKKLLERKMNKLKAKMAMKSIKMDSGK